MKNWIPIAGALSILLLLNPDSVEAGHPVQFLGVCQKCQRDLVAYYRPVLCTNGAIEWQWVTERHQHCRPVYKGREKFDFFHSHLMNPANPKWKDRRGKVRNHPCCG